MEPITYSYHIWAYRKQYPEQPFEFDQIYEEFRSIHSVQNEISQNLHEEIIVTQMTVTATRWKDENGNVIL